MARDDDDPPESPKRAPRALRPAVRAFLSRKDVVKWVFAHAKSKVSARNHEQVAQDALGEAVEHATWPASDEEGVLWATLRTVTDRTIADYHEKRTTRRKYEGKMPEAPTREDEVGERVPDEEADRDPAHDPRAVDARFEGVLIRRFLATAVKGKPRDEETLGWMLAWSDEEKSYDEIAREAGVNGNTVRSRVHTSPSTAAGATARCSSSSSSRSPSRSSSRCSCPARAIRGSTISAPPPISRCSRLPAAARARRPSPRLRPRSTTRCRRIPRCPRSPGDEGVCRRLTPALHTCASRASPEGTTAPREAA